MNTTATASTTRIHPLMAGAAVSFTVLCLVGAASVAGILPNSRAHAPAPAVPADLMASNLAAPAVAAAPVVAATVTAPVTAPVVAQAAPTPAPAPVVHKRVVHHVAQARPASRNDDYAYREPVRQQAAPAPAQPNYVGIGTGAVIGGLIGNQVGGGRGKALATVAGVIGGGFLGNAVQNQVQQPQR